MFQAGGLKNDLLDSGDEAIEEGVEFLGDLSESTRLGTKANDYGDMQESEKEVALVC
jgi:hypothetical protein